MAVNSTRRNTQKHSKNASKQEAGNNSRNIKMAQKRLKQFRQASVLTVSLTGFLLILLSFPDTGKAQENFSDNTENNSGEFLQSNEQAADEAFTALQNLWANFLYNAPKVLITIVFILLAWLIIKLIKYFMSKGLRRVSASTGIITLTSIFFWSLVVGIAFSIITGDMRALVGSFGLIGLALSWALQTPIESFTGWLLNAFKHYYSIGDRIKVGEVFGDVYKIDFLTTTVWEIGSPWQSGFVSAEQPTGRLVTFPNNEILAGSVINLTGDFPYVWDELVICVANESDIQHSIAVMEKGAEEILGSYMKEPAKKYARILNKAGLPADLSDKPEVYISVSDSWTEIIVRYLVDARERRVWKTKLLLHLNEAIGHSENKNKIIPVYPRHQVQFIQEDGRPKGHHD
ncbi:MAG: mechanosensitive ion channel family protein [Bacteroidota bacterium]